MSDLFDAIKAALTGTPTAAGAKKATDAMAGPGSVAGAIKDRRDAAMYADEDANETAARVRRQHADHNN